MAIRSAHVPPGPGAWSLQTEAYPFDVLTVVDAGDAPVVPGRPERSLRVIHEKVRRVARAGAIPIVLGGDHSITFPSAAAVARVHDPARVGIVHFDAHADTAMDQWGSLIGHGQPMRRLIDEGWVAGSNFVQVGFRGYWPDRETFEWMRGQGLRWHTQAEIEDRRGRGGDRRGDRGRRSTARTGSTSRSTSTSSTRGWRPAPARRSPGGCSAGSCCVRSDGSPGAVDLVGMDVVEVAPRTTMRR